MGGLSISEKKNLISDKIKNIYTNFSQILFTKEEFLDAIEQSFEGNQVKYLKENTIKEFYDSQTTKFWDKIENDRANELIIKEEAKKKYQEMYEELLLDHKKEIMKIQKSKELKIKEEEEKNQKLEKIVNEFKFKLNDIEKKAEEERQKMENFKKII